MNKSQKNMLLTQDDYKLLYQSFKTSENKKLNHTKLAKVFKIPQGNSDFRFFVKGTNDSISDLNLNKILDYFGYEMVSIPVPKNSQEFNNIKRESILELNSKIDILRSNLEQEIKDKPKLKTSNKVVSSLFEDIEEVENLFYEEAKDNKDNLIIDLGNDGPDNKTMDHILEMFEEEEEEEEFSDIFEIE